MIGTVRGKLTARRAPHIVVECGGIGYEIETPMSTFLNLPEQGSDVFLHAHLQVREDAHTLYGFATYEEKRLFQSLLKVSGVGARMGLAILSGMTVEGFVRSVQHEDAATLVKIPGVGKKTAERLIIEMRDRLDVSSESDSLPGPAAGATNDARGEAFEALVALGYKPAEVKRLVAGIDGENLSAEDIIRGALKQAVN